LGTIAQCRGEPEEKKGTQRCKGAKSQSEGRKEEWESEENQKRRRGRRRGRVKGRDSESTDGLFFNGYFQL